ncbi:Zn-ribbon domain-containing OB-fold protein [Mycobacterium genavense]|uniref:Zn-ribbon domain-containing OB-fold protein n=1 Tax=Mycobacterium genavense TaxID=36812 RepID=UPI000470813C|nr:OB-fold domain-containing protein [Mycobacterium genavense]
MTQTQVLTDTLFRVEQGRAVLFGSRRRSSGLVKFPAERSELFDGCADIDLVELSTQGTLYTYTTQEFAPPLPYKGNRNPQEFRPYIVGFIELPEGLLVESLIVGVEPADIRIGQRMVSTTVNFETADGGSYLTFAFTPSDR